MAAETSGNSGPDLLPTDDLRHLKAGDIYTDPTTGKQYRVRKTMLPQSSQNGPVGIGDPTDRTLRKIEADVLIPNRMNTQIERVECNTQYMDVINCLRAEGAVRGLSTCKSILALFNSCKAQKFRDPAFRMKMTEEYIKERSDARQTGMNSKQREIERYRLMKAEQDAKEK